MNSSRFVQAVKDRLKETSLYQLKMRCQGRRRGPKFLQDQSHLPQFRTDTTFVVICGGEFDQSKPNAATTSRLGWCRGFEQLGIPSALVSAFELDEKLSDLNNPICWIAGSDYAYLDRTNLQCLKRFPHAVLVSTAFAGESKYFTAHDLPSQSWGKRLRRKILSSQPRFLFTISPESTFDFYEDWVRSGATLVSLPLACDSTLYCSSASVGDFKAVNIAFVGGYWPYKARQFDQYLRPFADRLHVYGYTPWPYGHFGGQLAADHEPTLYMQARVSPVINEPHVSLMGVDINERVFKVLGSGGLAVTDATPGYRSWFSSDELLVPSTLKEYREMLQSILEDRTAFEEIRRRGQHAVLERHTYRHRAEQFCELMNIPISAR